jgi:hypothetical protein
MTVTQQAGRITKKAAAQNKVPQPFLLSSLSERQPPAPLVEKKML